MMTVPLSDCNSDKDLQVFDSGSNKVNSGALNPRGICIVGVADIIFLVLRYKTQDSKRQKSEIKKRIPTIMH